MTRRFYVQRTVEEYIVVEAEHEDAADITAAESPVEQWTRTIKDAMVEDISDERA